ncbi:serine hydrolase [Paralimibaculum aggregatum]|uniref:Serine hydrolase n=1 Tax=Paralimibaculum aggregatum TaxID=3036245 RepID=A0ABQ6LSA2_9RHOB|nr:serine hydrolase [Limibaculum sp. NKW23]GMG84876.1 serine hydrolase [Limibaculum sp. NKW23]
MTETPIATPAAPSGRPSVMTGFPPPPEARATLANWRQPPFSAWSFTHTREIVPSAEIPAGTPRPLEEDWTDLSRVPVPDGAGGEIPFAGLLAATQSSACVVLQGGRLLWEWHGPGHDGLAPHLLFSVSKSITGLVAGQLADRGLLDPSAPLTALIPELAGSAYEGATLRHLLDMTVSTAFDESYLNADGDYAAYRISTNWNPAPDPAAAPDLRGFLTTLKPGTEPHGAAFHYVSPNSDLLGWVIERASGQRFADLMGALLWGPIGAEAPAYITVDRFGAPRTAGGICARPRDLARLGEAVRRRGVVGGRQVLPGWWLDDMATAGDRAAWARGDLRELFPAGRYRSKWYQTGLPSGALACLGIHGQWLWIDPEAEVVIAKCAHQDEPACDATDARLIAGLDALCNALA